MNESQFLYARNASYAATPAGMQFYCHLQALEAIHKARNLETPTEYSGRALPRRPPPCNAI